MLFSPTLVKNAAWELNPDELKTLGIGFLLLDADNTLREHHAEAPCDGTENFISTMQSAGITLVIASNSKSSNVREFANKLGLPLFNLCKKPLPFKVSRAIKEYGFRKSECAIVGDQLFTDILCAELCGIKSVLVTPVNPEKQLHFRIRRAFERPFLRRIHKNDIR